MYTRWGRSSPVLPTKQTAGPSLMHPRQHVTPHYVLNPVYQDDERVIPACAWLSGSGSSSGTICRASPTILLGDAASASSASVIMSHLTARHPGILVGFVMNTIVYILGNKVLLKGLSLDGYASSWVLGFLSFSAFGVYGYSLVCLYFLFGSWVTKLKMDVKLREGTAEAKGGRRGIGSVLGSGFAGMVCAGVALTRCDIPMSLLQTGFVASFCSKISDTVSSEIGKAYGKKTYLATTFKSVPRGTEGAVSLEGTLAGILASFSLGCCAVLTGMITIKSLVFVTVASFTANYAESVLGAVYQESVAWLTNDVVNIFQITCASIISILLSYYFM